MRIRTFILVLLLSSLWLPLRAKTGKMVVPKGYENFFLDVFKDALNKAEPKGLKLEGIEITKDKVKAVVQFQGKRIDIFLVPAEEGVKRTEKFGIVAPNDCPSGLLNAIVAKLHEVEQKFEWAVEQDQAVTDQNVERQVEQRFEGALGQNKAVSPQNVQSQPQNNRYLPIFPKEATLVEVGKGVKVQTLPQEAASDIAHARKALQERAYEKAKKIAGEVASKWHSDENVLRACASVMRGGNSPKEALKLLKELKGEALLETAATYLLLGEEQPAQDAIEKSGAKDTDCGMAQALLVLLEDGLVQEAKKIAQDIKIDKDKRCVRFLMLKLAMALEDEKAIDSEAQALLSLFPDDEDALYLWGLYYYMRSNLNKAVEPWLRLVQKNYRYPAVLGQLGSAMLTAGMLNKNELPKYLKKAYEDENDVVSAFLAGVGSYYQHDYKTVVPLLSRVAKAVPDESRAKLYLAMSLYFLDNFDEAARIFDELEPYAYHDPDIYYCRSLIWRARDLQRAIREMEKFLEVFVGENRLSFGPEKVEKAKKDLERMKRGEIPELNLPGQELIPAK